ncbi:hypothetical protein BGX30_010827 [Mortierella sp. GBA39]|nr:hypothetical protein BGX30_010827 [Mortierella sp. GBA39]
MSQRSFSFSNGNSSSPLSENATIHGRHSPKSSLLNRSNTASRPTSPSNGAGATVLTMSQQHSPDSGYDHHNPSTSLLVGQGGASGSGTPNSKLNHESSSSYFPPMSSDYSVGGAGNNGFSKRSRFGVYSGGGSGLGLYPPAAMRRWKWWNYLVALILTFAVVEAFVLLIGSSILYTMPDQIQIDSRDFRKVEYQGLALDPTAAYKKQIQVYHVTKEFGAASMGGLGMVVTALAAAQQKSRTQKVNIVMPYYSMLDKIPGIGIKLYTPLPLEIKDNRGRTQNLVFTVHKFKFAVPQKPSDFETDKRAINAVTVWLIGPGDIYPFDRAFQSKNVQEIYSTPSGLPGEWKDLYFSKAVAAFIQHQNKNDDISLFATAVTRMIDVVHVHGATNALVLHYLQQSIDKGAMGEEPPALIYTLHDYLDELQYSNEIVNVQKFMDRRVHSEDDEEDMFLQMDGISPYCHGHRMFTSAMGIDLADAVTFVSKSMAKDIVEGRLDFYLKELVLGSVLNQAEKNLFIGITNGVDFGKLNPWTMTALREHDLSFPSNEFVGQDEQDILALESAPAAAGDDAVAVGSTHLTFRSAKEAAKHFLYTKGLLTEQDLTRPLVLFIGRFQYNKGLEFFTTASTAVKENGGRLIIMGQPNNFPLRSVTNLERLFVTVIADAKTQDEWGVYYRAAADFLLVPSLTESFGLIAAEGLLFGSTVISSGVGGLSEFLVDRPNADDERQQLEKAEAEKERQFMPLDQQQQLAEVPREERYNSYLFDPFAKDSHSQLTKAIGDAITEWKRLQRRPEEHEEFLIRLVNSAKAMGWDRSGGPVDQYRALYEIALNAIGFNSQSL